MNKGNGGLSTMKNKALYKAEEQTEEPQKRQRRNILTAYDMILWNFKEQDIMI